jgi:ribosomal protein S18 acetylase RimI-like enzyme
VLAVQRAAYAIEAELIGYPDLPPLRETLAALQATEEELWLCCEGDALVGVVGLEQCDEEMVIARLFVAPSSFRRGVGSALVAHALAQAAGRRVRVGTGGRNAPALALYERFGFHRLDDGSPTQTRGYVELVREP